MSLESSIHWHKNADDQMLLELFKASSFTVYPSIEEGFGLPVAESIWHHRICLCSCEGALGELSRLGGCVTVDVENWFELATGLARLQHDHAVRNSLQKQLEQRVVRTWRNVASDLSQILKNLL